MRALRQIFITSLFLLIVSFGAVQLNVFGSRDIVITTLLNSPTSAAWPQLIFSDSVIEETKENNMVTTVFSAPDAAVTIPSVAESYKANGLDGKDYTIEDIEWDGTNGTVKGKVITIADSSRVAVAVSSKLGTTGELISTIAKTNEAVLAVNGGGFSDPEWKGNGGIPFGVVIRDNHIWIEGEFRSLSDGNFSAEELAGAYDVIGLDKQNVLRAGRMTLQEIFNLGIRDAVSFGPTLIQDGTLAEIKGNGGWGVSPRSAIGQRADGAIVFLVLDGRQPAWTMGATMKDLQNIFVDRKCVTAANLDGGSSAIALEHSTVLNKPSAKSGEYGRYLPTIWFFK